MVSKSDLVVLRFAYLIGFCSLCCMFTFWMANVFWLRWVNFVYGLPVTGYLFASFKTVFYGCFFAGFIGIGMFAGYVYRILRRIGGDVVSS